MSGRGSWGSGEEGGKGTVGDCAESVKTVISYEVHVVPHPLQHDDGECEPCAGHMQARDGLETHILSLALHDGLASGYYYCPHRTDVETEAQRNGLACVTEFSGETGVSFDRGPP